MNPFSHPVNAVSNHPFKATAATVASSGGGPTIPALAIKDRAGNYILDRAGNYIVSRV